MTGTRWMAVVVLAVMCAVAGEGTAGSEGKPPKVEQKVNINEASKGELMKLAGVGAGTAERIISYREAHGPFKRAQDLQKVDGVGKTVLEKNPGRIVVK